MVALVATMVLATMCGVAAASAAGGSPKAKHAAAAKHAPTAGAADRAAARKVASLRRQEHALQVRLDADQAIVLQEQVASHSVEQEQARVRGVINEDIVQLYQHGGDPDAGSLLLGATDVNAAVHVTEVTHQFARWRKQLERQYARVQENVAAQHDQARVAMDRMVETSRQLDQVQLKIDVELGAVADRQAARAARAAAKTRPASLLATTLPAGGTAQLAASVLPAGGARATAAAPRRNGGVVDTAYVYDTSPPPGFGGIGNLISIGQGMVGGGAVTSTSAQQIDLYLMGKGSPMAGAGALFIQAGQRYGMDPRLVVAISGAESSFGTQTCGSFNAWGWGCPNSPGQFASWGDGIDRVARGLRTGYLNEGRTTIAAIHEKYAPIGAANDPTGLNSNWVQNVSKFLMEMGGNPNSISTQAVVLVPDAPTTGA